MHIRALVSPPRTRCETVGCSPQNEAREARRGRFESPPSLCPPLLSPIPFLQLRPRLSKRSVRPAAISLAVEHARSSPLWLSQQRDRADLRRPCVHHLLLFFFPCCPFQQLLPHFLFVTHDSTTTKSLPSPSKHLSQLQQLIQSPSLLGRLQPPSLGIVLTLPPSSSSGTKLTIT